MQGPRKISTEDEDWYDEDEDWMTPEGYYDDPDQGVHRFDGGGTFF